MNVLRAEGIQLSEAHYGFSVTNTFIDTISFSSSILAMVDRVKFFGEKVKCLYCSEWTLGNVEEFSGQIQCDQCYKTIFDASDCTGTVMILNIDDIGSLH